MYWNTILWIVNQVNKIESDENGSEQEGRQSLVLSVFNWRLSRSHMESIWTKIESILKICRHLLSAEIKENVKAISQQKNFLTNSNASRERESWELNLHETDGCLMWFSLSWILNVEGFVCLFFAEFVLVWFFNDRIVLVFLFYVLWTY